jgi:hypothetical protein
VSEFCSVINWQGMLTPLKPTKNEQMLFTCVFIILIHVLYAASKFVCRITFSGVRAFLAVTSMNPVNELLKFTWHICYLYIIKED